MEKILNRTLHIAKSSKKDEFYTQLPDIENELQHYKEHFKNKVVFCNSDDPRNSNFFKYFAYNFENLGLKKIITIGYKNQEKNLFFQGESEKAVFLEYHSSIHDKKITNAEEMGIKNCTGNGDFRSKESIELLKKSDIVVTNPPFSLFREYVDQLVKYEKKFLIIGNINAITYKEIFKLIKENKVWLGINMGRGISGFIVPEDYKLFGTETRIDKNGNRIVATNNCLWLTNLDTLRRHEDIVLTKKYYGNERAYPKFDNYDAINVNKTQDIPMDYDGVIGVPITFLHKYNPEQFELIKFRKGNDEKDLSINGQCTYFRILIKNKRRSIF
ncbi:MAG: adenine-specific methyltransferase EcoRI family protein [Phycisphaerales bacterium]|nr:adenine-specific methyltransferase EcoRI family protein [Phycisphaerales bacterium]